MDLAKVIQQLHEELRNLDAAILSLERLEETGKRRGRPPSWMAEVGPPETARPKRQLGRKPLKESEDSG